MGRLSLNCEIVIYVAVALMLAVRPYYWPNDAMGHSPPIATRAGWISIAIMPFMMYATLQYSAKLAYAIQCFRHEGQLHRATHWDLSRETASLSSLDGGLYVYARSRTIT